MASMSLPGLQLDAPDEQVSTSITHDIKEKNEWRFEVPFGSKIEVKVGLNCLTTLELETYHFTNVVLSFSLEMQRYLGPN